MKKFKMLMMFVIPLVVVIVAIAVITGFLSAVNQTVSMDNSFQYEKHIGSGTKEDPYLIYLVGSKSPVLNAGKTEYAESGSFNFYAGNNKDNKNYFEAVNSLNPEANKYNYFKQVEDIELKDGDSLISTSLLGYYNGDGKTFKTNQTIFSSVGNGTSNRSAYVNNLKVQTVGKISANAGLTDRLFGTLENIEFSGSISSKSTIEFDGTYKMVAGGLVQVAYPGSNIKKCRNLGTVESEGVAGGLIGMVNNAVSGDAVLIQECFNKGNVYSKEQSTKGFVGGLVGGMFANINIYRSYNLGTLNSLSVNSVGGLVGLNRDKSLNLNQTYSVVSGTGNSAFVASGNCNANSSIGIVCDNGGSAIADSGSTVQDINVIQNSENYDGWFDENSDWVMAFDTANIGSMNEQKLVNLFSPHLFYELEKVSGNFNLNYDNGEATSGTTPETRTFSTLASEIQIQDNLGGLTKIGYAFKGWSTIKDASSPLFYLDETYSMPKITNVYSLQDEVTLYPVWELKTSSLYINPNFGSWKTGRLESLANLGFEFNETTGYLKAEINAKKSEFALPTGEDIEREGYTFKGFKVVSSCEGVYPSSIYEGAILTSIPAGTCGNSVSLEAIWEGNDNIDYYIIYELANKTNGFASGTETYIFKKTGRAGTVISLDTNFYQTLGYSLEVQEVRIYEEGKPYEQMQVLSDASNVMANVERHYSKYELNVQNTKNTGSIIDGDGNTIASVKFLRNVYNITLIAGEHINSVRLEQNKNNISGEGAFISKNDANKIVFGAIYGVQLNISAIEESGFLAIWYKVLSNGSKEKYSQYNEESFTCSGELTLEAAGVGGYTLEIYANNGFASLNTAEYEEYISSLDAKEQGNYIYDDYYKVLRIKSQKLGENVLLPLVKNDNGVITYELFKVLKENVVLQNLLGFSLDKNALNPDSNIISSINSNMAEVQDGVIKIYAIWTKFEATLSIRYLSESDATYDGDPAYEIGRVKTFSAVRPTVVSEIEGINGDANKILLSRDGFKFLGFRVAGENAFGGIAVGNQISIAEIMMAELFQDVEIVAEWEAMNVSFKVLVYKEKLDGTYEIGSNETISGYKAGELYDLTPLRNLNFEGFHFKRIDDSFNTDITRENVAVRPDDYVISVYFDRNENAVVLEKNEGIKDVYITYGLEKLVAGNEDVFKPLGLISIDGGTYIFKYGSEITIFSEVEDGYSFDCFKLSNNAIDYSIIGYNQSVNVKLTSSSTYIQAFAQSNYRIRLNLGDVITSDMVNILTNDRIEVVNGEYYLKQKFSVKMQYDSNSYLKFALYELKAEYDNCQQQIGWSDGNKNIITWDIAGNLVINSEFGLDPNVDNIADLYAVWTTNTYGLDVDYQSELMDNIYGREIVVPTNFANLNVNLEPVKTGYNLDYFTMQIDKTNSGVYSYVLDNGNNKLTKEFLENYKITRSVKLQAYWTTSNTETNFSIVVEIVTDYGNSKNEYYIQSLNPANIDDTGAKHVLTRETNTEIGLGGMVSDLENQITSSSYDVKYYYKDSLNPDWTELTDYSFKVRADGSSVAKIQYVKKQVFIEVVGDANVKVSLDETNYFQRVAQYFEIDRSVKIYLQFGNGYEYSHASEKVSKRGNYYEYVAKNETALNIYSKTINYTVTIDEDSLKDTYLGSEEASITGILGAIVGDGNTFNFSYENGVASYTCVSRFDLPSLTKKGYLFRGYKVQFENGAVYSNVNGTKLSMTSDDIIKNVEYGSYANITLSAEFEAVAFNVRFEANKPAEMSESEVTVPAGVITVYYGEEFNLGIAETDNSNFGFKGWATHSTEGANTQIISDANGKGAWSFVAGDFEVSSLISDNEYDITVYAFWSEFKKEIKIGGDASRIKTIEVSTVESNGGANAKVVKVSDGYSIYLNDGYVIKLALTTTEGFDFYEDGERAWVAGENTTFKFNKYNFALGAIDNSYSASNFELNLVTDGYKLAFTGNTANLIFNAKCNTYTLKYNLNYANSITTVADTTNAKSTVIYQSNSYSTVSSSLERLLTPTELINLGLITISEENGTTNGLPNGYKFAGWYKDENCTLGNELMYADRSGNWICNAYKIPSDLTIYAKWTPIEFNINLVRNYNNQDYSVLANVKQKFNANLGEWFSLYPNKSDIKEGYNFKAWAFTRSGDDGNGNSTILSNGIWDKFGDAEFNLYAIWEAKQFTLVPDANKYSLKLQSILSVEGYKYDNPHIEIGDITNYLETNVLVEFDKTFEIPKQNGGVPERVGYKFYGWYAYVGETWYPITDEFGNSKTSVWNVNSDNNEIIICPIWMPDKVNVTLNVYNANINGEFVEDEKSTYLGSMLADTFAYIDNGKINVKYSGFSAEAQNINESSDADNYEIEFYHNGVKLTESDSWIAYADGGLVINIKYARKVLHLSINPSDNSTDKIDYLSLNDGVESKGNSLEKDIVYGKTITINAGLFKGVEWQSWYNGDSKFAEDKEYTFEITEDLNLIAMVKYTEFAIVYNEVEEVENVEFREKYTKIDAFDLIDLTDKRAGYTFLGYELDVCEDANCNHASCRKYYNATYSENKFVANLVVDGKETIVELNLTFDADGKMVKSVKVGSIGKLVLKATWEGNEGTKFRVILKEQNLLGEYNQEEKTLYAKSGTVITKDKTLSFYDEFDGTNYVGNLVNIYDFDGLDEECFDNWELIVNNNGIVKGDGSTVVTITKYRKVLNATLDLTESGEETFKKVDIIAKDSVITILDKDGNVLKTLQINQGHQFFYETIEEFGKKISLKVFYGGSIYLEVTMGNSQYKLKVYVDNEELVAKDTYTEDGATLPSIYGYLVQNITSDKEIYIGAEELTYKAKLNTNDSTWKNGSTLIQNGTLFIDSERYDLITDNGYNGHFEIKVKSRTLTELPELSREGYKFLGWTFNTESTGTITSSNKNGEYYKSIAGVGNHENEVIFILTANWQAEDVNVSYVISMGGSNDQMYKFDSQSQVSPSAINEDEHSMYVQSGKRFLGWFTFDRTAYLRNIGLDPTTDWVILEDCTTLTDEQKAELAKGYAFGVKNYSLAGKSFNVKWNSEIVDGLAEISYANLSPTEIEKYLYELDSCNQYLNNIDDFANKITLYAWYIKDCYQINFDLNLDEALKDIPESDRHLFANVNELTITWTASSDYENSQKTPTVEVLKDWGKIVGYALYKNEIDAGQWVEGQNYFTLPEGQNYLAGDIASKIINANNGNKLYAIWQRNEISISYDMGFDNGELNFVQTESAPFKATFISDGVDYSNLMNFRHADRTIDGLGSDYYSFKGWKITFEGEVQGLEIDNENFYLTTNLDKEISVVENIKNKYATFSGIKLTAVWELTNFIIRVHSNYASDVTKINSVSITPVTEGGFITFDTSSLTYSKSGIAVGVSLDKNACIPDFNLNTEYTTQDLFAKTGSKLIDVYMVWLGSIDKPFVIENIAEFNYLAGVTGETKFSSFLECKNYFEMSSILLYFNQVEDLNETDNEIMERTSLKYAIYTSSKSTSKLDGSESWFINVFDSSVEGASITINNAETSIFASDIEGSKIKKLSVYGSITKSEFGNDLYYMASVALTARDSTFTNVSNYSNIKPNYTEYCIGGLIAEAKSVTFENCVNYGEIDIQSGDKIRQTASTAVGGIVGLAKISCNMSNVKNYGNIKGYMQSVGGLVGVFELSASNFNSCENYGKIDLTIKNGEHIYVGGLVGFSIHSNGLFARSINHADITINGKKLIDSNTGGIVSAGGIIGAVGDYAKNSNSISLSECINFGSIIDNSYSNEQTVVSVLGGMIGYVGNGDYNSEVILQNLSVNIKDSYTTGVIKGETSSSGASYASGIIGYAKGNRIEIVNCYSMSALEGKFNSGIAGLNLIKSDSNFANNYYVSYNYNFKTAHSYKSNYLNDETLGTSKTLSQMQEVGTYNNYDWNDVTGSKIWVRANSSNLIYAPVKVQGIVRLVRLPRLWFEKLEAGNFNVYYNVNDSKDYSSPAELINVGGTEGNYILNGTTSLTYDNSSNQIKDNSTYNSSSTFTIADGESYRISDYANATYGETSYRWFFRPYYNFVGFALDPNASKFDVISGDISNVYTNENLTFYAIWEPIEFIISYENLNGALNAENPTSYNIESNIELAELSGLAGYKFKSWYNNSDLADNHKQSSITAGTVGNKTFYAGWDKLTYNVIINVDNNQTSYSYTIDDISNVDLNTIKSNISVAGKTFGCFKIVEIIANADESASDLTKILSKGNDLIAGDQIESIDLGSYGNIEIRVVWKGSTEDAYEIDSVETFNRYVNEGTFKKNYYFKLTNDLVISDSNDILRSEFIGTLDGAYVDEGVNKNHSITVENSKMLFAYVDGTIKNIDYHVVDFDYKTVTYNSTSYMGVITGKLTGTFENIKTYGNVSGMFNTDYNVGLIGKGGNNITFKRVENYINFDLSINSVNTGYFHIGAFIGNTRDSKGFITIQDCLNAGDIVVVDNSSKQTSYIWLGGFIGDGLTSAEVQTKIVGCANIGNVSLKAKCNQYVGGLIGAGRNVTISYSYNLGAISVGTGDDAYIGGFMTDYLASQINIEYSYNLGKVEPSNVAKGDLIAVCGETSPSIVTDSYYLADSEENTQAIGTPKLISNLINRDTYSEGWYIRKQGTARNDDASWYWQWIENGKVMINGTIYSYSLPRLWWEDFEFDTVIITYQNDKTNPTDSYSQEIGKGVNAYLEPIKFSTDRFLYWIDDEGNIYNDGQMVRFSGNKTLYAFYTDQDGSMEYPYLIASVDDFNKYATSKFFGNVDSYFRQTADIVESASNMLTQTDLLGHYDGGGHTITRVDGSNKSLFQVAGISDTVANISMISYV